MPEGNRNMPEIGQKETETKQKQNRNIFFNFQQPFSSLSPAF